MTPVQGVFWDVLAHVQQRDDEYQDGDGTTELVSGERVEVGRSQRRSRVLRWEDMPEDSAGLAPGRETSMRRDARLRRMLAVSDIVGCVLALLIVVAFVGQHTTVLTPFSLIILPAVVLAGKVIGLYDHDQHRLRKSTIDDMPLIFGLSVGFTLGLWMCEAVLLRGWMSRAQVIVLGVLTFLFVAGARTVARGVGRRVLSPERCLIVGSGSDAARTVEVLGSGRVSGTNATVVAQIAVGGPENGSYAPEDLALLCQVIASTIFRKSVERVVMTTDVWGPEQSLEIARLIKALGVKLSVQPRLLEVVGSASTYDELNGVTMLAVRPYGLSKSSRLVKRIFDLSVAVPMLIAISPVLAVLALAVKCDSRGPVFFRQRRIGRGGEEFEMMKLRSMVPDAEHRKAELHERNEAGDGLFKIADDPRITRVGRFLRRTSLDELPQLLNVVKGDMSLVGPRPLIPSEDGLIDGWRRRRLVVQPGMTGMWQIYGSARIPMQEMVKIDYMYGANWSLWLDLKIMLRTVPYMISGRGM